MLGSGGWVVTAASPFWDELGLFTVIHCKCVEEISPLQNKSKLGDRCGTCLFTDPFIHATNSYWECLLCPRHWSTGMSSVLSGDHGLMADAGK